jgi:acetyltransferase-like isoleucine patch superfamily enzyme
MELSQLLNNPSIASNADQTELLKTISALRSNINQITQEKFKRTNPFLEDITDWKERGDLIFGKGKNITVYGTCTVVGQVQVGENTWVGPYTALDGTGGLTIGKGCSISSGVNMVSHDSVKWALSGGKQAYEHAPISVGDYCFIGTNVFITKGVSIGKHCLIGAGAVVTKNIPDYSIALGVPARVVGKVKLNGDEVELVFFDK